MAVISTRFLKGAFFIKLWWRKCAVEKRSTSGEIEKVQVKAGYKKEERKRLRKRERIITLIIVIGIITIIFTIIICYCYTIEHLIIKYWFKHTIK